MGYPVLIICFRYGAGLEGVSLPPRELFVRWMQANVFMPAMQFSFVPWQYDQEVRFRESHIHKIHATFQHHER